MTTEQLDKLKALAERATPGPWAVSTSSCNTITYEGDGIIAKTNAHGDAEYIAAVSPDVVMELIEQYRELEEAIDLSSNSEKRLHEIAESLRAENRILQASVTHWRERLTSLTEEHQVLTEGVTASAASETYLFNEVQSLRAQLAEAREVIERYKTCRHFCADACCSGAARAYLEKYPK